MMLSLIEIYGVYFHLFISTLVSFLNIYNFHCFSLVQRNALKNSFWASLLVMSYFRFYLSENVFILPSLMKNIFTVHRILDC